VSDRLGVLSTTRFVVDHAQHVRLDMGRLEAVCRDVAATDITVPPWNRDLHWSGEPEQTAMYVFVLDSLNFCFWGEPRWKISYHDQELDGYWALAASLRRAVEEGKPILDASYLATMPDNDLAHILRGTADIPLYPQRLVNLHELGEVLATRFGGDCARLIESAQGDAVELAQIVARQLSSFNDVVFYKGHTVRLYKRAQILVGDVAGSLDHKGLGDLSHLDELTCFADYKLPQILRRFGVLEYSADLGGRVDARVHLAAGSEEEVEIRAHTVWAVELMRQELQKLGRTYNAYELDWWLWESSQHMAGEVKPYHRTRTIYY
jgi:Queuosine salvage protein